MKKRNLILIGILALCAVAAGCGKKETTSAVTQVTSTPIPTPEEKAEGELIDMQKDTEEDSDIKNVIGNKSALANEVVLVNQLGNEIVDFYVRPHTDLYILGDDWRDELIQDAFTLKNTEKARYYFETEQKDSNDEVIKSYDIRVTFRGEDADEYFFRELPLNNIKELKLCVDGTGDNAIPYARYTLKSGDKREFSTLEDVKRRLGMQESEGEETEDPTPTPQQETAAATATPTPADNSDYDDDTGSDDPASQNAEQYIGQSLSALIEGIGSPSSSEYVEEPETGTTGYHYYDTFTVSTSVDEDGNEVVAGVW